MCGARAEGNPEAMAILDPHELVLEVFHFFSSCLFKRGYADQCELTSYRVTSRVMVRCCCGLDQSEVSSHAIPDLPSQGVTGLAVYFSDLQTLVADRKGVWSYLHTLRGEV